LDDLAPETAYHYRLVATNSAGASYGNDCVITTQAPPISRIALASLKICEANLGVRGTSAGGGTVWLLMSTNLTSPLSRWAPIATNLLNGSGEFSFTVTNAAIGEARQQFFILTAMPEGN
jgi:hypothetical protein